MHSSLDDPVANAAGPGNLVPPEDKSIKRLVLRGRKYLSFLEQDIREKFVACGEIEFITIRSLAEHGWACITYKTRQGAEKATQELSEWLVVNGQRLRLAWVREPEPDRDSLNQHGNSTREAGGSSTSESNKLASSSDLPVVCDTCLWERLKMCVESWRPESGDHRIYETPSQQRERHRQEFLSKADPLTLKPPEDKSIRTLLVRGLDSRILFLEQDLRNRFVAYGEIQSITIRPTCEIGRACAFVTFGTRQGAEKASQELSEGLVLINGQRVQVTWRIPYVSEPDEDSSNHQ